MPMPSNVGADMTGMTVRGSLEAFWFTDDAFVFCIVCLWLNILLTPILARDPSKHSLVVSMPWLFNLLRRISKQRILVLLGLCLSLRLIFVPGAPNSSDSTASASKYLEIREHNVLERVTRTEKTLNPQKHKFLQVRMGRDERRDLFTDIIQNGVDDFWERFQKP
jgi:hypothetical protein